MKILSIDVGIKNLAYCLLDISGLDKIPLDNCSNINQSNNFHILKWDICNLCGADPVCNYVTKNGVCNKKATYSDDSTGIINYYCKTHAKKVEKLKLPPSFTQSKLKSMSYSKLNEFANEHKIPTNVSVNGVANKKELYEYLSKYIDENSLNTISKQKASEINCVDIGKAIMNEFNCLFKDIYIDYILLENQIGPIANRMKSIQGMITQYFIMSGMENVVNISSSNKLKFYTNEKLSYEDKKKKSIEVANLIANNHVKWRNMLMKHKKQDDLADSLLQAIWFISKKIY